MTEAVIIDQEWARKLERQYQDYIYNCEEGVDSEVAFETITGEYFCGCSICYTREQIAFLAPRIIEGYLSKKLAIEEDNETGEATTS